MKNKTDILTPEDVKLLVNQFYNKVKSDDLLAKYFVTTNWDKHLPLMYKFWENIAFSSGNYAGNPMLKHQHIHKLQPITEIHFKRWMKLFTQTMHELFEGKIADLLLVRAQSIAKIMIAKILS